MTLKFLQENSYSSFETPFSFITHPAHTELSKSERLDSVIIEVPKQKVLKYPGQS
jgi:hypothetical protein